MSGAARNRSLRTLRVRPASRPRGRGAFLLQAGRLTDERRSGDRSLQAPKLSLPWICRSLRGYRLLRSCRSGGCRFRPAQAPVPARGTGIGPVRRRYRPAETEAERPRLRQGKKDPPSGDCARRLYNRDRSGAGRYGKGCGEGRRKHAARNGPTSSRRSHHHSSGRSQPDPDV
jgi:hypothetical protein